MHNLSVIRAGRVLKEHPPTFVQSLIPPTHLIETSETSQNASYCDSKHAGPVEVLAGPAGVHLSIFFLIRAQRQHFVSPAQEEDIC